MSTIEQTYYSQASILRVFGSSIIGALATLAIFAGMHHLIKEQAVDINPPDPIVMINAIMDEITESQAQIKTIKPPPELISPPQTPNLLPTDHIDNLVLNIPNFSPPRIDKTVTQPTINVDQQPRPIVRVNPSYPNVAARDGIEGFVTLSFSINVKGEVEDIKVLSSEPKGIFERNAQKALRKWKYQAKQQDGQAVSMQGLMVTLEFKLGNS